MKWLDYYLQRRRFNIAGKYISPKSSLLDIGCNRGEFFIYLKNKEIYGTGFDPDAETPLLNLPPEVLIINEAFPSDKLTASKYNFITALAVIEHIQLYNQVAFTKACHLLLSDSGKMIITVPSPIVDYILHFLRFFRLINTMSLEQHYGFNPNQIVPLFHKAGFKLILHKKFEFGLNNLFVFAK